MRYSFEFHLLVLLISFALTGHCLPSEPQDQLRSTLDRIEGIQDPVSTADLNWLIEKAGDLTEIPDPVIIPAPPITVANHASHKLASLASNELEEAVLKFVESSESVSLPHFVSLLEVFDFGEISDRTAARLQAKANKAGKGFIKALLFRLAVNKEKVDEKFDLIIASMLESDDVTDTASACTAIANRRSRVLLWNDRLVELCAEPMMGAVQVSADIQFRADLRNYALLALRVNGFPSESVTEFLTNFSPERGTELYWQHKATMVSIVGDEGALTELLEALRDQRESRVVANVLSQDVALPMSSRPALVEAVSVTGDEVAARIVSIMMEQFSPDSFSATELAILKTKLDRWDRSEFDDWLLKE